MNRNSDRLLDTDALPGEFAVFEHFLRPEDMNAMARILREEHIRVRTADGVGGQWRENVIIGHSLQPKFWIEIPTSQFAKARYVIKERAENAWAGAALLEHPFAEYTTNELKDVLRQEERYGIEAGVVARNLLLRRGDALDLEQLRTQNAAREREELRPQSGSLVWVFVATVIGVVSGIILQPLLFLASAGVLMFLGTGTRRGRFGKQYYVYTARTRVQGKWGLSIVGGALVLGVVNFFFLRWVDIPVVDVWLWWWR